MAVSPLATFVGHTSSVKVTDTFTFVKGSSTAATVEVATASGVIIAGAMAVLEKRCSFDYGIACSMAFTEGLAQVSY